MPAVDFPLSPFVGQPVSSDDGVTWYWNGFAWQRQGGVGGQVAPVLVPVVSYVNDLAELPHEAVAYSQSPTSGFIQITYV